MNICILAPENSPSWGGVGAYTFNLLRNLPKGNEIHVVTMNRDIEDSFDKQFGNRLYIHNIINIRSGDSFFYNLKFQIAILKQLKKLDDNYEFDVIHSHSGHLPHLFSQFLTIAPLVVTVHATVYGLKKSINEYGFKEDRTESWMKQFSRGIQYFEKVGFKKADRLLPISKFTLKQINEYYDYHNNNKLSVLYNAVDLSLFDSNKNLDEEPTIIFVGRLYAIKGIDVFLDALRIISRRNLHFRVRIIGRGETERIRKRLLDILPKNKFEMSGRISYFNMPKIYNSSDILVVSSIYENCPTTILEAMCTRTLVIASDAGGIPEIIKDGYNGFLFKNGDANQLANILEMVILNLMDINPILKNAMRCVAENYDWGKRGIEIYREYEKVAK